MKLSREKKAGSHAMSTPPGTIRRCIDKSRRKVMREESLSFERVYVVQFGFLDAYKRGFCIFDCIAHNGTLVRIA